MAANVDDARGNCVNILVVGDRGVGKRTLIKAMAQHPSWDKQPMLPGTRHSVIDPIGAAINTTAKGVCLLFRSARRIAVVGKTQSMKMAHVAGPISGVFLSDSRRVHPHPGLDAWPRDDALTSLPYELRFLIATYFDATTLEALDLVSRRASKIVRDDRLWEYCFARVDEAPRPTDRSFHRRLQWARRFDKVAGLYHRRTKQNPVVRFESAMLACAGVPFTFYAVDSDGEDYVRLLEGLPTVDTVVVVAAPALDEAGERALEARARRATAKLRPGTPLDSGPGVERFYNEDPSVFCFVNNNAKNSAEASTRALPAVLMAPPPTEAMAAHLTKLPRVAPLNRTFAPENLRNLTLASLRGVLNNARTIAQCRRAQVAFNESYGL